MGNFTAKLVLPKYIPKNRILRKHVFDSELKCIGFVKDWTYASNGEIYLIVQPENRTENSSDFLIPFFQIDKIGHFVVLKTRRDNLNWKLANNPEKTKETNHEEKPLTDKLNFGSKKDNKSNGLKYFTEIDEKKLDSLVKRKE